MGAKWVELLRQIAPRVESITLLFNPAAAPFARMFLPSMQALRSSARFDLIESPVGSESDVERAITAAGSRSGAGLIVLPDSFLNSHRDLVVGLTASAAPASDLCALGVYPQRRAHCLRNRTN